MTTAGETGDEPPSSTERLLAMLEEAVEQAHRKAVSGRVRNATNERVRMGWIRTLAYAAQTYSSIESTQTLESLSARLDEIEAELEATHDDGAGAEEWWTDADSSVEAE